MQGSASRATDTWAFLLDGANLSFISYLDSLHEKVEGLRRILGETQHSEQTGLTEPLPIPTAGGTVSTTSPDYSGTGSIFRYTERLILFLIILLT